MTLPLHGIVCVPGETEYRWNVHARADMGQVLGGIRHTPFEGAHHWELFFFGAFPDAPARVRYDTLEDAVGAWLAWARAHQAEINRRVRLGRGDE